MEFLEFLDLDVQKSDSKKLIMGYILDILNGLDVNGFELNPISINSIIKKFVVLLNFEGLGEYEKELTNLANALTKNMESLSRLREAEDTGSN